MMIWALRRIDSKNNRPHYLFESPPSPAHLCTVALCLAASTQSAVTAGASTSTACGLLSSPPPPHTPSTHLCTVALCLAASTQSAVTAGASTSTACGLLSRVPPPHTHTLYSPVHGGSLSGGLHTVGCDRRSQHQHGVRPPLQRRSQLRSSQLGSQLRQSDRLAVRRRRLAGRGLRRLPQRVRRRRLLVVEVVAAAAAARAQVARAAQVGHQGHVVRFVRPQRRRACGEGRGLDGRAGSRGATQG